MSPHGSLPFLTDVIAALEKGEINSTQLVESYILRIRQVNGLVNAVSQVNPGALADATTSDEDRAGGRYHGQLHGIPVLVKETMATLDEMETTAGSLALVGSRPSFEATVVRRLRASGAVILGKGTVTEWSNTRASNAPNGWSATSGQCYGAFYGRQDPQGSSSGCAVAASIGLAAVAVGAETWGSITFPAQSNGVVGLKPTVGLVSRAGVIPVSDHKDTVGPIARSVKDAALVLNVIAGHCDRDKATDSIPFEEMPDFTAACQPDALQGARLAVSTSVMADYPYKDIVAAVERAVKTMETSGATIVRDVDFDGWKSGTSQREQMPSNVFLREGLESYFKSLDVNPHNITTMSALVEFLEQEPDEKVEKYGIDSFTAARDEPFNSTSAEFHEAVEKMNQQGNLIKDLLDRGNCDALVVPTTADIPYDLGQNPAITVPLGVFPLDRKVTKSCDEMISRAPNIPYALTLVGRKWDEQRLIGLAYALEQVTQAYATVHPCVIPSERILPSRDVDNARL